MSDDHPSSPDAFPPIHIWRFRTREGSVRLGVVVPEHHRADLHQELRGCATVADSMVEFLALAGRAIHAHDGVLGDILRQPWAEATLSSRIHKAAQEADPRRAAQIVLDATFAASPTEADALLHSEALKSERAYLTDLAVSLDEYETEFVTDLAGALRITPAELAAGLEA